MVQGGDRARGKYLPYSLGALVGLTWPSNLSEPWAYGVVALGVVAVICIGVQGQMWPVSRKTKEPMTSLEMARHANVYGVQCMFALAGVVAACLLRYYILAAVIFDFAALCFAIAMAASWKLSHATMPVE